MIKKVNVAIEDAIVIDSITGNVTAPKGRKSKKNKLAIKVKKSNKGGPYWGTPEIVAISPGLFGVDFVLFEIRVFVSAPVLAFADDFYRDGILKKLKEMGFYKRKATESDFIFICVENNIIKEVSPEIIRDEFFRYNLPEDKEPLVVSLKGLYAIVSIEELREVYLRKASKLFTPDLLLSLETHDVPLLKDTTDISWFCFLNVVMAVDKDGLHPYGYDRLEHYCIWKDNIIQRELTPTDTFDSCHYARFIRNVAGDDGQKLKAFHSAIGYLLNNYNNPSRGQAVVCYDEVPSKVGEPAGGTGKGVFSNGIKQLRNVLKVDGKKIRQDDRFRFQGITSSTQVFWLDDVHKDFPFEVLHSVTTDGWNIERKYKNEFFIPAEEGPKVMLCSNTIVSGTGSTNKRRIFILEFSDHYSKKIITGAEQPIKDEHGCIFFDDDYWDAEEWQKFYSFMLNCSKYYHDKGLRPYTSVGQERSRLIQTTDEAFVEWLGERKLQMGEEYDTKVLYEEYCISVGEDKTDLKPRQFNRWLLVYAETRNCIFSKRKSSGRTLIKLQLQVTK